MYGASRESLVTVREALTSLADGADAATLGEISEDLLAVVRLLDREGSLRRTLGDPALQPRAKEQLVSGLLGDQLRAEALARVVQATGLRWSSSRDLVDALEDLAVTAAFLQAQKDGELDRVQDELFRFDRAVAASPELRATLTDRGLADDRKRALLDGLLEGKAADVTRRVVETLVLLPRGRTLEDGLEQYGQLAAAVRVRTLATVTSAVPLDEAQRERLAASLTAQLGRQVQLQVEVDPRVVGGVLVRVGEEVIDGSIRHRLAQAARAIS